MKKLISTLVSSALLATTMAGCNVGGGNSQGDQNASPSNANQSAKNVIFFLGDGMGMTTMTAARIYSVGEDGELTMDQLPESAFVRTYSNDAMVTDSAPSMAAYVTGVKMNNEVISMSANTSAVNAMGAPYVSGSDSTCPNSGNGTAVPTLLELAKAAGRSVGAVTTARATHATPATTYAHICHRDGENDIAAQLVMGTGKTGTSAYNTALLDGIDVLMGGGRRHFSVKGTSGSLRTDSIDLIGQLKTNGYSVVQDAAGFNAIDGSKINKLVGLFTNSHMTYEVDRDSAKEPSLTQMTQKALDVLTRNNKGFFLMVEGGRIDHALHETTARRAMGETIAFDTAIKDTIDRMQKVDPGLKNTLIVVTADHDHSIILNGYAKRTGKTVDANQPGVLGFVKNVLTGANEVDKDGFPYTIIGFGNGENAVTTRGALTEANVFSTDANGNLYHQEATIPRNAGDETHGGADVFLGAIGLGADSFMGVITNTEVFQLIKKAVGL